MRKVGCYNCGELNHRQSSCIFDHKIRCGNCQYLGHKSRLCRKYSTYRCGEEDSADDFKPKKDSLVIEHIHALSILLSIDEVDLLIEERNIDVLCITETWFLPHTPDNSINVSNFKVFRCDKGRSAGACIYVRNKLKANLINLD